MSAAATLLPTALGLGLLTTGRGWREGFRYESGMAMIGAGTIVGPSVGQLYARGGLSAVLTFTLRALTSSVMLFGLAKQFRGGEENDSLGTALSVVGGVPTGLLAIYDIFNAATQAEATRYEAGYAQAAPLELMSISRCGAMPCSTAVLTADLN